MGNKVLDSPDKNRNSAKIAERWKYDRWSRKVFTLFACALVCLPTGFVSAEIFGLETAWQKNVFAIYGIISVFALALLTFWLAYDFQKRRKLPPL